ncbi:periplasmic binding protein-like I [Rhizoclosmatium globosum]|uniref:Periplasmic binding protein-like I n=1 Tax=Rhizoclosmatium globosum TaxID=329046 RepID=A0A1Y2CR02_9FUNG|nr:periplasmic binding protein-like I [Rhizoclosmatium globosum]|eukprot:ORY49387.1 periplasmic binding protein-like I [Rhizoclosmatium globosum]
MDSAAEWVVDLVNNQSDILPNTTVNILRVQGWDGTSGVGGAAKVAVELGEKLKDVVVAFGETNSASTKLTSAILSHYKIPSVGNRWGADLVLLLNRWNVWRAAIVYDANDEESVGACLDIKENLFRNDIVVLSQILYNGSDETTDFEEIAVELKAMDARYIILCAQSYSRSYNFVVAANQTGLISKDHVWVVTNPPYPIDYKGSGNDSRLSLLLGMITFTITGEVATDPNFVSIQNGWAALYHQNPSKYQVNLLNWANQGAYDCVGLLLYGLHRFLETHPTVTPLMLSNREYNHLLNYTAFMKTGFNGTAVLPMIYNTFSIV